MGGNRRGSGVRLAERERCRGRGDLPADRQHLDRRPEQVRLGIIIDPKNPNQAWLTYSGYNANTPTTPGHVFQVDYNPVTHQATWTDIDNGTGPLGDLPVTGIARDATTGTLYVSTDFNVLADSPGKTGTSTGTGGPRPAASPRSRSRA